MTKFEEKKKEAYEKASIKHFGNADGSRAMRYLLNELENAGLLKEQQALPVVPDFIGKLINTFGALKMASILTIQQAILKIKRN